MSDDPFDQLARAQPGDVKLRRRAWPWLVGVPVVAAGAIYWIWQHERAADRADSDHQYPVANQPGDAETIASAFARWQAKQIVAAVAAPPAIESLKLGAACDKSIDDGFEFKAGDTERATSSFAYLFESARRGRYYDENDRQRTLAQLVEPTLVVKLAEQDLPEMTGSGSNLQYYGGRRAGAAYVYDIDAKLLCAGAFEAASSHEVDYTTIHSKSPVLDGDRRVDARRAVGNDFDKQTHAAIVAALRHVE